MESQAIRDKKNQRLGEILLESGYLTERELDCALEEHKRSGARLGFVVVSMGFLAPDEILVALAQQTGSPIVDLSMVSPCLELIKLVPEYIARKHLLVPLEKTDDTVTVAMVDPLNLPVIDDLSIRLSAKVEVVIASERQMMEIIDQCYGSIDSHFSTGSHESEMFYASEDKHHYKRVGKSEAPIARLAERIIETGVNRRASDIHIEPVEKSLRIRYRIDGVMFTAPAPPKNLELALISRIKILAKMDIAETRIPQDGGFKLKFKSLDVEFRVSIFPTIYGESAVIRIFNKEEAPLGFGNVGLVGQPLALLENALAQKAGLIIVTGSTGSGKTTTLYSALDYIRSPSKIVVTIEDPVEYNLDYVRQTQVNHKAGYTFAGGMRSILRQDPDVIMVGEIRDQETAALAVQAAMTGHLTLTTMHTTSAAQVVTRLLDLEVEPYKIAATFLGVLSQELVRRVCRNCFQKDQKGCAYCNRSGYRGRVGLFEFIKADNGLRELIIQRASAHRIKEYAIKNQKTITLREDGLAKVKKGITTIEEIDRGGADRYSNGGER